ncbi:hypothetical protein BJ912DRAFT_1044320 [Pholiota molesta]|nr:hypothetical protein BJ912DRAFT_1044320 [Pholiota molesta]
MLTLSSTVRDSFLREAATTFLPHVAARLTCPRFYREYVIYKDGFAGIDPKCYDDITFKLDVYPALQEQTDPETLERQFARYQKQQALSKKNTMLSPQTPSPTHPTHRILVPPMVSLKILFASKRPKVTLSVRGSGALPTRLPSARNAHAQAQTAGGGWLP